MYKPDPNDRFSHDVAHLLVIIAPLHEKNNNFDLRPGLMQTILYSHKSSPEA